MNTFRIYIEYTNGVKFTTKKTCKKPTYTKIYKLFKNKFDYNENIQAFGYEKIS